MARIRSHSVGDGHRLRPTDTHSSHRTGERRRLQLEATRSGKRAAHRSRHKSASNRSSQVFSTVLSASKELQAKEPGCSAPRFLKTCDKARSTNYSEQRQKLSNMFSSATSTQGYLISSTRPSTIAQQGTHATHLLCCCLRFGLPFFLAHRPRCLFPTST